MNNEIDGKFDSNTCSLLIYNASAILRFALLFSGLQPESNLSRACE